MGTTYLLQIIHLCHYEIKPAMFWKEIGFEIMKFDIPSIRKNRLLNAQIAWHPTKKTALELLFEKLNVTLLSEEYLKIIVDSLHLTKDGVILSDRLFDASMTIDNQFALKCIKAYHEDSAEMIEARSIHKKEIYQIESDEKGEFKPWKLR